MHILLIHQAFASLDEAGGTRHYEMARNLIQHGHQVTVITSPISYLSGKGKTQNSAWIKKEIDPAGLVILRTYTYPALHRSFFHRLISFFSFMVSSFSAGLGVKNVDLVWGTSPPIFQGFTAWLLARLKGARFLFEIRDLWPAFAIGVGVLKNRLLISASLWLERFLYTHADQVIVNSPGYINHVTQKGAKNVVLIPNGVDPAMFSDVTSGEKIRAKYNLGSKFIALYAGAHGLSNDLEVVLQAANLLKDHPEIVFVFVGDGKEKSSLIAQSQSMGLSNVIFIPPVSKNEMASVLAASDACIAILKPLELYKTTYPNKVFDYMAASRAVILAIDGVIRQVVEKADGGIFVTPGNSTEMAQAVQLLASQPVKCKRMGLNGRNYVVQNFDRTKLTGQFLSLIESMVKDR